MRIIDSKGRRDFYDPAMKLDEDRSIIYYRDPSSVDVEGLDLSQVGRCYTYHADVGVIGFCGNLIPFVTDSGYFKNEDGVSVWKSRYFYTSESLEPLKETCKAPDRVVEHWSRWIERMEVIIPWQRETLSFRWMEGLFAKYNVPIFVTNRHSRVYYLELNPILDDYNFVTYKDLYTTYQELSQYVCGTLVSPAGREPRPVPDEIKRDMAGFDDSSFKRGPTKGEKSRKRRGLWNPSESV